VPPHSSHLQPLDIALFGPLKRNYRQKIEKLMRILLIHISREDFFPAFKDAFFEVLGKTNVQSGFREADLIPRNPETLIVKLNIKSRTPTPNIEFMSLPKSR
jgi:hypothetical protein